jgi:hypothetical protein
MSLSATVKKSIVNNNVLRGQKEASVIASRNFGGFSASQLPAMYQRGGGGIINQMDSSVTAPAGNYRTTGTTGTMANLQATGMSTAVLTAQLVDPGDPGLNGGGLHGQVYNLAPLAASEAISIDTLNANRHYIEVVGGFGGRGQPIVLDANGDLVGFPTVGIVNQMNASPTIHLERRAPERINDGMGGNTVLNTDVARAVYVLRVRDIPPRYVTTGGAPPAIA